MTFNEAFEKAMKAHPLPDEPMTAAEIRERCNAIGKYIEELSPDPPFSEFIGAAIRQMRITMDSMGLDAATGNGKNKNETKDS